MRGRRLVLLALVVALTVGAPGAAWALYADSGSVGANAFATDTLDPPTNLLAVGGLTATLTWTPTLDAYATGYRVLRSSTSGGPYSLAATVTPRTTALHVDSPGAGLWYYVLEAFHGGWTSVRTTQVSALVL